jgi:serine/threonine protein kinase/Flp pilus assembly protein TadD
MARGYRRFVNARERRERHDAAYYLFEVLLKYVASAAMGHYLAREPRDHRVNAALKGLARPSLGEWLRFLRECLTFLSESARDDARVEALSRLASARDASWPRVLSLHNALRSHRTGDPSTRERVSFLELFEEIVAYRNRVLGHGAPLEDSHYARFADLLAEAFLEVLSHAPWLTARRLVAFDSLEAEGELVRCHVVEYMGHHPIRRERPLEIPYGKTLPSKSLLYLLDEDGRFTSLHPFLVAHREDVYVLNEAKGSPEYLSYASGERHRPSDLAERQGELFERILGYRLDASRVSRMGEDVEEAGDVAPETAASAAPAAERRLGDYRVVREIGRGGMGTVFEAVQESLGRRVALKVLPGTFALDPKRVERFRREARATAKIHHPNIVPVYEVGESDGTHYYAMEYVDGHGLDVMLARAREDPGDRPAGRRNPGASSTADPAYIAAAVEQIAAVAEGLHEAHRQGLIHRDVKPSNILVDRDGRYVLVDFGLVHETDGQTLTRSGEMLGTLNYMSPEQVSRGKVDARADVYGLGATLYEILTLRTPFERGTEHETQRAILFEEPAPPRRLNARLNRDLETILLHGLEKNPEKRYGSAKELAADLRRFLRYEPIEAKPQSAFSRITRRMWQRRKAVAVLSVIAALCVAVTVFGVLLLGETRGRLDAEYRDRVERSARRIQLGRDRARIGSFGFHRVDPSGLSVMRDIQDLTPLLAADPVLEALDDLRKAASLVAKPRDARYYEAKSLILLNRLDDALLALDQALRADPHFVPAMALKGLVLERMGKPEKAREALLEAESVVSTEWARAWLDAHRSVAARDWAAAEAAYGRLEKAIEDVEPLLGASVETRLGRGLARLEAGRLGDAMFDFHAAHVLWDDALEPVILLGKTQCLRSEVAEADARFVAFHARQTGSRKDEVAARVAQVYRDLGELDRALEWARRLSPQAYQKRTEALFLHARGQNDEALRAIEEALGQNRDDATAHFLRGRIRLAARDPAGAREDFEKALVIERDNLGALIGQCLVLEEEGRLEDAEKLYRQLGSRHASNPWVPYHLGWFLVRHERENDAVEAFREADRREPRNSEIHRSLGVAHFWADRYDDAEREYELAVKFDPKNPWPYISLGWACFLSRRFERGEQVLRRAIELDPNVPEAHRDLALILGESIPPRRDLAIESFEKAISCDETFYSAWHDLGYHLKEAGRRTEALRAYRRTVELGSSLTQWNYPNLCALLLHPADESDTASEIEQILPTLERNLKESKDPRYHELLGLAYSAPTRSKNLDEALRHAESAREKRREAGEPLAVLGRVHAVRKDHSAATVLIEESFRRGSIQHLLGTDLWSFLQRCRKACLPDLPSLDTIDAALEGAGEAERRKLLEGYRPVAVGPEALARLEYLEGRIALLEGRPEEARVQLERVRKGHPFNRHAVFHEAESLLALGRKKDALATLSGFLATGEQGASLVWDLWLETSWRLEATAAEVLEGFPVPPGNIVEGSYADDVLWLLRQLSDGKALRINCGGTKDHDASDSTWSRDRFSRGGDFSGEFWRWRTIPVDGTDDDLLFQQFLQFGEKDQHDLYRIPVPPGPYRVVLHFAELDEAQSSPRTFDVWVQGTVRKPSFGPPRKRLAVALSLDIVVEDGPLTIGHGNAPRGGAFAAIEIRPAGR